MQSTGDPRSRAGLDGILRELGMAPARRWGQNFLVNKMVLDRIAVLSGASSGVRVFEIGPGLGALTLSLLDQDATVTAVELDRRVHSQLSAIERQFPGKLHVAYEDALVRPWEDILKDQGQEAQDISIVGNLPYYITAPILGKITESSLSWIRATLMVQKEVADRLLTEPGHRMSSALGVLLRYRADVVVGMSDIPPSSFYPVPEVFSTVIQLVPHPPLPVPFAVFRWVVRSGFRHRRKTLRQALAQSAESSLSKNQWQSLLEDHGIASSLRAEALTMEEWVRLAAAVEQRGEVGDFRKPNQGANEF